MKTPRNLFIIAALALSLLLAACSQPGPEAKGPTPDGIISVSLGLSSSSLSSQNENQGFTTLGSPFNPDGTIAVTQAQVTVTGNGSTSPVRFTFDSGSNTYTSDPAGTITFVTLTQAEQSATLELPAAGNPYTFESYGYANVVHGVIAYELQSSVTVNAHSTVWVALESVLGSAVLTPRYPTNFVTPGKPLDLMLIVMANNHHNFPNDYLQVPLSDFEIPNGYTVTGATEVSHSKRGIRVTVDQYCTNIAVTGVVTGLLEATDGTISSGTIAINDTAGFTLACPTPLSGNIATDLTPPTVTNFSYNPATGVVTGDAEDDFGIASVQIFDGPVLLASTIDSEITDGAAQISFTPSTTAFQATVALNIPGGLMAVAFDPSGNEGRSEETVDLMNVWVDDTASPSGNGSSTHPFKTIQEGLDAVDPGGTIHVKNGTYRLPGNNSASNTAPHGILIDKTMNLEGITIRGQDEEHVLILATEPGLTHGIRVAGVNNVTLENFTLVGPTSATGRGIQVQGNPSKTSILSGLVIRNVTVEAAGNIGITLTITEDSLLENVTISSTGNTGTDRVGIQVKGSRRAVLRDIHTNNNLVGVKVMTNRAASDVHFINGAHNITFQRVTSTNDGVPMMTEEHTDAADPEKTITGLSLDNSYTHSVTNSIPAKQVEPNCHGSGTPYTYYVTSSTQAEALDFCGIIGTPVITSL